MVKVMIVRDIGDHEKELALKTIGWKGIWESYWVVRGGRFKNIPAPTGRESVPRSHKKAVKLLEMGIYPETWVWARCEQFWSYPSERIPIWVSESDKEEFLDIISRVLSKRDVW